MEHGGGFDQLQQIFPCDVISWNLTIWGHVKCGQGQKTLELCQQMQQEQV